MYFNKLHWRRHKVEQYSIACKSIQFHWKNSIQPRKASDEPSRYLAVEQLQFLDFAVVPCIQNMPPIILLLTVTGWQLMRAEARSMGWDSSEIESNEIDESSNTNSAEDHSSDAEGRINLSMPGKHSTAEINVS